MPFNTVIPCKAHLVAGRPRSPALVEQRQSALALEREASASLSAHARTSPQRLSPNTTIHKHRHVSPVLFSDCVACKPCRDVYCRRLPGKHRPVTEQLEAFCEMNEAWPDKRVLFSPRGESYFPSCRVLIKVTNDSSQSTLSARDVL